MTTAETPTTLPELVVDLFREALGNDGLTAESDFFEEGGDSLSALRITAGLGEALGVEVPVALVFSAPTPAELAAVVAEETLPGAGEDRG
ncbi:Acyl carrier protein [Streptomyces zhaozhouensis]|uniref:Acyl carrier protein n=1 Tax=Streptomyces zhaozhouensis TaxID=1300267 RepID=A0A286EB00_9ACTN|nr:phosphopantetheine-binding protein [Streptomyces zhaozhouensis]SOD68014.1 Acyl carrier protein [Streptomyces zhaozhouensis]